MTPEQCKQLRINYYVKITLIDEYIGRIVNTLKEKGLLDNTWIIYNSDHGEMLGDHFLSHKVVFYEGATRVPLIIRPPGGVDGWKCKGLTDHLDIAATLIDIADATPLKESDGITLVPKVQKGPNDPKAQEVKEVVFSEVYGFSMVRNDRYKMTVNTNSQKPVELFDLQSDPEELTNIVNDPSMKEVRESLKAYLKSLLKKTDKEKLDKVKSLMKKVEKIL